MKSILYVGATLMLGASIYGFVDYQQTSHKKEFNNMYKTREVNEPAKVITEKKVSIAEPKEAVVKEEKALVTAPAKKETKKVAKKKKRKLDSKLFSRGALDERYIKEEIKLDVPKEKKESVKSARVGSVGENKEQ